MLRDEDSQGEDSWGEGCSRLRMLRDEDGLSGNEPPPKQHKAENKTMDNRFLPSQTPIPFGLLRMSIPHIPTSIRCFTPVTSFTSSFNCTKSSGMREHAEHAQAGG